MQKVIVRRASANYDDDLKVADASKTIDIGYTVEDDQVFINIEIGGEDHYITLALDRSQLIEAITKSLTEPEDAE